MIYSCSGEQCCLHGSDERGPYKVDLAINAEEPMNKGVITAIKGSKLVNNTLLHFFLVDGQIM